MNDRVLIVGFSGRAAASSARRAGFTPIVIDCFADRDTQAIAETHKCPPADFPGGLLTIAAKLPKLPVVFTGGMEHHPDIIAALRGPSKATESLVKFINAACYYDDNLSPRYSNTRAELPRRFSTWQECPPHQTMLTKPFRSGGGIGIRFANPDDPKSGFYLQPFFEGQPHSACMRRMGNVLETFGITRQLVGLDWLHAKDFMYCGNMTQSYSFSAEWRIADRCVLATAGFSCNMPLGVDLVLRADDTLDLIEVNPRYTASMEVVEHHSGRAILAHDVRHDVPAGEVGKAIYYAPHYLVFPKHEDFDRAVEVAVNDPWALPEYADIPHAGDRIPTGAPVLTLLTRQPTTDACIDALKAKAAFLDSLFAGCR